MLKKCLLGYSIKDVDILLTQMENELNSDKSFLEQRIKSLEEQCETIRNANQGDLERLEKADKFSRLFKISIEDLHMKNRTKHD